MPIHSWEKRSTHGQPHECALCHAYVKLYLSSTSISFH